MKIKDIISSRRKQLGLRQAEIAKACEVSEATVSRWEHGYIHNIKQSKVSALAKILQVPASLIIGDTEDNVTVPTEYPVVRVPVYKRESEGLKLFSRTVPEVIVTVPLRAVDPDKNYFFLLAVDDSLASEKIDKGDYMMFEQTECADSDKVYCYVNDRGEILCRKNDGTEPGENYQCRGLLKKIIKYV